MQQVQIAVGLLIILFTFLDFFHTTLSGNGFGAFSGIVNRLLNRILIQNQNRKIFNFSGVTHLLVTTFLWLSLLVAGTYIIFSSGEFMVIDSSTKLPANQIERFYYTMYLLSTLGIGNFIPGSETSEIISGILSLSGFILVTTGLTYLLNVVNSVLSKKQLAYYISTLGADIAELYEFFKKENNLSGLISDSSDLRQQILKNSSSYIAFPMVNFFLSKDRKSAVIVQLAILYEVIMVLRLDWEKDSLEYSKLTTIIRAVEQYLELGLEKPDSNDKDRELLLTLRGYWRNYGYKYERHVEIDEQFSTSLKYSGWTWEEVYQLKPQKPE